MIKLDQTSFHISKSFLACRYPPADTFLVLSKAMDAVLQGVSKDFRISVELNFCSWHFEFYVTSGWAFSYPIGLKINKLSSGVFKVFFCPNNHHSDIELAEIFYLPRYPLTYLVPNDYITNIQANEHSLRGVKELNFPIGKLLSVFAIDKRCIIIKYNV